MTEQHVGRRIARAMITIFIFQLFLKFGAMIVKLLALNRFGTPADKGILDAFTFAEGTIVWTLYVIFDKSVLPTFTPLFSEERDVKGEGEAWKFANTYVNLLLIALCLAIGIITYWTPEVVDVVAPGWRSNPSAVTDERARWAVVFCRWMVPALFFVSIGSFTYALLNSYKRFGYGEAGAGMHRFAQAFVFVVAFWVFGAPAVWAALAFVIASPVKLITHLVGLRDKLHYYRPSIPYWRTVAGPAGRWMMEFAVLLAAVLLACRVWVSVPPPLWLLRFFAAIGYSFPPPQGVIVFLTAVGYFLLRGLLAWLRLRGRPDKTLMQKLYLLAYPVVVGVLIARFRDIVQDSYATELEGTGLFSAFKIAKNLGDVPTAIVPVALSMAMFPFLCDLFTKQNLSALSECVSRALKMIVLFILPFTAVVVILRLPVMQLVSSEQVDAQLIDATSLALALYALGFVFYAVEAVLMQTFFSLQNTWIPTLVGGIASLGQIGFLYLAFHRPEGGETSATAAWLAGIGLTPFMIIGIAFPLSRAVKNIVLAGVLHARVKLFHARDIAAFVPQVLIVTGATALPTWAASHGVASVKVAGIVAKAVRLGVPCTAALAGFLGALFLLKWIGWPVAEFDIIFRWLHETGWQKIKARVRGKK